MRRVNPGYIECLISEMQNLTDRMDEIIERDWNKFLNHVKEHQQKEVIYEKKDNDFYQSIYSLMKKKLDYRMDKGVEHDLRKFLNHVQDQKQKEHESKKKASSRCKAISKIETNGEKHLTL